MIGYIYVLWNKNGNYIGSTFNMKERIKEHKHRYISWNNKKGIYRKSFEIVKDEFQYEVIEEVNVETLRELTQWEQYYMDRWDCVNEKKAYRSEEDLKDYFKQYNEEHKEEQNEKAKDYYEKHKEHYKQYREEHKEEISKKRNERIVCECGLELSKSNKNRHLKSQRHQDYYN